jgi:hypothetical protein
LLCAFGSQKDRWGDADSLAAFSGIAPVTRRTCKQLQVQRRYACPKYLRQTFHEFADSARIYCPWTRARYCMLRDRGMKHHAAIRKLAHSWIRILYRVWQTRTPFDSDRYIAQLKTTLPRDHSVPTPRNLPKSLITPCGDLRPTQSQLLIYRRIKGTLRVRRSPIHTARLKFQFSGGDMTSTGIGS